MSDDELKKTKTLIHLYYTSSDGLNIISKRFFFHTQIDSNTLDCTNIRK